MSKVGQNSLPNHEILRDFKENSIGLLRVYCLYVSELLERSGLDSGVKFFI
jgi:hypothetical protein